MNISLLRRPVFASAILLLIVLSAGCAVYDGGYYGDIGIGMDYYQSYGNDYGGWGPGYFVGPFHDGGHHQNQGGDHRPGQGGGYHPGQGGGNHPGQGGGYHPGQGGSQPGQVGGHPPPYRPAPESQPIPSIPLRFGGPRQY